MYQTILPRLLFALSLAFVSVSHAGGVAPAGPDANDPSLRLWLDASDDATLWQDPAGSIAATNGSAVARWEDKSLSGIVVTQANTNNTPTYTNATLGISAMPTVLFANLDGGATGDALSSSSGNSTGITGTTNLTLITIWKNTGFTGSNYQHTFHMGNNATSQAYGHSTSGGAGLGTLVGNHYWGSGYGTYDRASTNATFALSSYDGTNDLWYINGTFAGKHAVSLNIAPDQLHIGSRAAPIFEGFAGHLSEVILYNKVLSQPERNALGDYVEAKYGIAVADSPVIPATPRIDPNTGEPNALHPDLRLWLDAGDTNTVWQDLGGTLPATNGSAVARWDDKSLSQIIVEQTSTGNQPVYASTVSSLADRAAVHFVGGSGGDALTSTTGNATDIRGNSPITLITIWQNTGFTGQNYQHAFHMGNDATLQAYGHSTSRGAGASSPIGNHYWAGGYDVTNVTAALNVPTMAYSSYDRITDTWLINGIPSGGVAVGLNLDAEQLQIGSRLTPFTEGFTGDLAEVILFGEALTIEERNTLGFYVQDKYGITIQDASGPVGFGVTSIAYVPGVSPDDADVVVSWESNSSSTYRLEVAEHPAGPWTTLTTGIAGQAGVTTYAHPVMGASTLIRRYFRIGAE
jgi:hypothetical protein